MKITYNSEKKKMIQVELDNGCSLLLIEHPERLSVVVVQERDYPKTQHTMRIIPTDSFSIGIEIKTNKETI